MAGIAWYWLAPFVATVVFFSGVALGQLESPPGGAITGERLRILVSSDIGGSDEDDIQSLIHLL